MAYDVGFNSRTSGAAITSMILGVFGFVLVPCFIGIPMVIAALILGLRGLEATRHPLVHGRGMATTGVVFGALGIAFAIAAIAFASLTG